MRPKTKNIDEYLATVRADQRAALQKLRLTIRSAAPEAEECISYGVPSFRLDGMLVGFGAGASHCSLYVMSTAMMRTLAPDLDPYDTSKGTVHFQPEKPLPASLVRRIVKARIIENRNRRTR